MCIAKKAFLQHNPILRLLKLMSWIIRPCKGKLAEQKFILHTASSTMCKATNKHHDESCVRMKCHAQCAEQQTSPSNPSYCAWKERLRKWSHPEKAACFSHSPERDCSENCKGSGNGNHAKFHDILPGKMSFVKKFDRTSVRKWFKTPCHKEVRNIYWGQCQKIPKWMWKKTARKIVNMPEKCENWGQQMWNE